MQHVYWNSVITYSIYPGMFLLYTTFILECRHNNTACKLEYCYYIQHVYSNHYIISYSVYPGMLSLHTACILECCRHIQHATWNVDITYSMYLRILSLHTACIMECCHYMHHVSWNVIITYSMYPRMLSLHTARIMECCHYIQHVFVIFLLCNYLPSNLIKRRWKNNFFEHSDTFWHVNLVKFKYDWE